MKKLLFQGRYVEVLALLPAKIPASEISTAIGAMSFTGRMTEALALYRLHPKLTKTDRIEARFFLSLGLIRTSQYAEARKYLAQNLQDTRSKANSKEIFYSQQGIAFYRYFCGRWNSALLNVEEALKAALDDGFTYGRFLATDLRGHILVQVANVNEGIRELKLAADLAKRFGHHGIAEASEISILSYEAQFGLRANKIVLDLKKKLRQLKTSDTYSRAALLLELSRQLMLRGKPSEVRELLDEASRHIYMFRNRRQEAILNLRWAYLSMITGEAYRALSFTQSASRSLDEKVDHAIQLQALGFELKIISQLKIPQRELELKEIIKSKSNRFGGHVHKQILHRYDSNFFPHSQTNNADQISEIISENDDGAFIKSNYLIFLYEKNQIPWNQKTLFLNLSEDKSVIFDAGEVHITTGFTPLLRKFLETLASGKTDKEALIKIVWGHQYHPLRHDPLIYNTVLGLRKILGPFANWIQTTENGYALLPDVIIKTQATLSRPSTLQSISLASPLNHRQLTFLKKLKPSDFINVRTYQEQFHVSEITACRDLAMLHREGYVLRIGRARATRYALNTGGQL